jgi:DNA-binding LacI/PurR family transcriptional regulator
MADARQTALRRPDTGPVQALYKQIEAEMAAEIRAGGLPPGSLLPSERQLCERFGVSPITVRRALLELGKQGLIFRQHGVGTFVADLARTRRLILVLAGFDVAHWHSSAGAMGELIGGVSEAAWRHNCTLHIERVDEPLTAALLDRLIEQPGTNGLLLRIAGNVSDEHVDQLEAADIPYIFIRRYLRERPINCVVPADDVGMRLAVAHLARLGHRHVGLLSAMPHLVITEDRLKGYHGAVAAHGLEQDESLVRLTAHWDEVAGFAAAMELLQRQPRPTAIVVDVDLAPSLYAAAADLGLDIPADVAVVGYDEVPEARALTPRLTCLRTSYYDTGRVAAEAVLEMMQGRAAAPRRLVIEPVLEVRESCGAARARAGVAAGID